MNGQIWVESEPGRGSTFSFAMPLMPVAPSERLTTSSDSVSRLTASPSEQSMAALAARAVFRILIVEDNLVSQKARLLILI